MSSAFHPVAGWHDRPACLDLAPKVGRIELAFEDRFIDLAKFGERKVPRQELERHVGVANLIAQPPECIAKNLMVIEGERFGQSIDRKPARFALPRRRINRLAGDQGIIGNGDSMFPRIAVRSPECIELLQICRLKAGFCEKMAARRLLKCLAGMDPTTRERPQPGKRL